MAIGGVFSGQAATAFNDSLLRWEQLQQQEEAARKQAELQERQLDIQEAQNKWQKERAKYLDAYNMGVHDDEMDAQFIRTTFENWDQMTTEGKAQAIQQFHTLAQDNPVFGRYAGTLTSMFSRGITVNPDEGMAILIELQRAEPGSVPYPKWMVELAAEAVANGLGMEGDERKSFIDSNLAFVDALLSDNEEARAAAMEAASLENQKAQAQIEDLNAGTALKGAQTEATTAETEFLMDRAPLLLDQLRLQNKGYELANFEQNFRNGILDERWALDQRDMLASIVGKENQNELFDATFEYQVRQITANTTMTEVEARVALATENAKILVANGQPELLQAQIDQINQATLTDAAQEDYFQGQTTLLSTQNIKARTDILTALVQKGQPELFSQFAPQLLDGFVPEEDQAEVIEDLTTVATRIRDTDAKTAASQAILAAANAEYAERTVDARVRTTEAEADEAESSAEIRGYEAEHWLDDRKFARDMEERKVEVQEGYLALENEKWDFNREAQIEQRETLKNSPWGSGLANYDDPIDLMNAVGNATTWDAGKVSDFRVRIQEARNLAGQLRALSLDFNRGHPLAMEYGLESADDAAALALQNEELVDTLTDSLVDGLGSNIALADSVGYIPSKEMLGIESDQGLYDRAMAAAGYSNRATITNDKGEPILDIDEATAQARLTLDDYIDAFLISPGALDADIQGASAGLYQALESKYGAGVLENLGIEAPADVVKYVQPVMEERTSALQGATEAAELFGGDLTTVDGRQALKSEINSSVDTLRGLWNQVQDITNADYFTNSDHVVDLMYQVTQALPPHLRPNFFTRALMTKGRVVDMINDGLIYYANLGGYVSYFDRHPLPQVAGE